MPYSPLNSNYWRLKFENPSIGSRVMWRQHYDIHTDRQTDIHTDIHTYRQTDGTKLLYRREEIKLPMLYVIFLDVPLSSPKPNKARQRPFAHRPKMNFSRTWANFYFEIFRKSPLFSPKCVK